MLLVVIVTNGFSPTVAGTLFAATSAFLILESVAFLGTDTGLVKVAPDQLASGRAVDAAPHPVSWRSRRSWRCPGAAPSALYASAPALAPHLVGPESAPTMTAMLRTLALILPVAALTTW